MYVGRIVAVGRNKDGKMCALYRVSSRSFPNREARVIGDDIAILPKSGFEDDIKKNPFIAYNCLKIGNEYAIVSNGTHTDCIALNLKKGIPPRDVLACVLSTMDYEHDTLNTPRIAGIVNQKSNLAYLGIVTKDSLHVKEFELRPGKAYYVATYDHVIPGNSYCDNDFDAQSAESACQYIINQGVFAKLERPVTAACATENEFSSYDTATVNAD